MYSLPNSVHRRVRDGCRINSELHLVSSVTTLTGLCQTNALHIPSCPVVFINSKPHFSWFGFKNHNRLGCDPESISGFYGLTDSEGTTHLHKEATCFRFHPTRLPWWGEGWEVVRIIWLVPTCHCHHSGAASQSTKPRVRFCCTCEQHL